MSVSIRYERYSEDTTDAKTLVRYYWTTVRDCSERVKECHMYKIAKSQKIFKICVETIAVRLSRVTTLKLASNFQMISDLFNLEKTTILFCEMKGNKL